MLTRYFSQSGFLKFWIILRNPTKRVWSDVCHSATWKVENQKAKKSKNKRKGKKIITKFVSHTKSLLNHCDLSNICINQ